MEGSFMTSAAVSSPYTEVLHNIQNNQPSGREELCRIFLRGVRLLLSRPLRAEIAEDRCRQVFLTVEQAILGGKLRDPEQLPAFIRSVVKEQGERGSRPGGEQEQGAKIMLGLLENLSPRYREAVTRFYVRQQPEQQICAALQMSQMEFRLLKAQVRQHFAERRAVLS
jgi:RNA polymerase sigma-70 factor (ECF subfamily)